MKFSKLVVLNIILMSSVFAGDKKSLVGNTALHVAIKNQDSKVVARLLKDGGVDVNQKNYFCHTPLHIAAKLGNIDIANQLLKAGAKINALTCLRETPLHMAVREGHVKMILFLLSKNADWQIKNLKGDTPVDYALKTGRADIEAVFKTLKNNLK